MNEPDERKKATVRVKPRGYQPSKAELEADARVDASPDEIAKAVLRPVRVIEDAGA